MLIVIKNILTIMILVSFQVSELVSYSIVSSNLKTKRSATPPQGPMVSPFSPGVIMETKMLKELHNLCMSGFVSEAGLIITDSTGENRKHWIYCNQLIDKDKSDMKQLQRLSFVEPAPMEQIPVKKSSAPKPPIVLVLPPKLINNYTVEVEYAHDDNNHPVSYNQAPPAPIVHFLNRSAI